MAADHPGLKIMAYDHNKDHVALWAAAIPATIIAIVRGFALWGGTRIAAKRNGADPAVVTWTWTGLLPQAGLALALALIMQRTFGELGDKISVLVLAVVGLNQLVGPVLMRIGLVRAGEVGKKARVEFAHRHGEDGGKDDEPQAEWQVK